MTSPTQTPAATTPESSPTASETSSPLPSPSGSTSSTTAPAEGEILVVTTNFSGGVLEVTAMVPGVSEAGGTCTLELVESGSSVDVPGTAGNGVTYCGLMSVSVPAADAATGTFRVHYISDSTQAESAATPLEPTT